MKKINFTKPALIMAVLGCAIFFSLSCSALTGTGLTSSLFFLLFILCSSFGFFINCTDILTQILKPKHTCTNGTPVSGVAKGILERCESCNVGAKSESNLNAGTLG